MRSRGRIRDVAIALGAAFAVVGLAGLVVIGPAPSPTAAQETNRWLGDRRIANMAHGGGLRETPQGTMYAYRTAAERGADLLEMDLHITLDGHVVAIHDSTVDRTTDGTGCVVSKTLDEIKALDAAHTFVPGVGPTASRPPEDYVLRGVRTGAVAPPAGFSADDFSIVTLEELFTELPDALMLMELKPTEAERGHDCPGFVASLPPDERPDLAAEVARLIDAHDMTDKVMVASFIDELMAEFQALAPDVDTSFPMGEAIGVYLAYLGGQPLPNPNGHEAIQVPTNYMGIEITEPVVAYARANGVAVHFWTINDPTQMHQLLDWGSDGLITDEPSVLDAVLTERVDPRPLADSSTELGTDVVGPVDVGTAVSFTATVEPGWPHPTPTGTVELIADPGPDPSGARAVVGEVEVDAEGRAAFVVGDLPVGTHTVTATYPGSSRLRPSSSVALTVEVVDDQTPEPTGSSTSTSTTADPSTSPSSPPSTAEPTATDGGGGGTGGSGTGGTSSLPRTGSDPVPLAAVGAALLGLGAVLTAARRRATSSAHPHR